MFVRLFFTTTKNNSLLFLSQIQNCINDIDTNNFDTDVKTNIFPYTDYPFAKLECKKGYLELSDIKNANISTINPNCFASDTGLIKVVDAQILKSLVPIFDFYELTDTDDGLLNEAYWNNLISYFEPTSLGLILSASIDIGFDIVGGGTYEIFI
jgi:hypothetical protein